MRTIPPRPEPHRAAAVVAAAGSGLRLGLRTPKPFVRILGKELILWTLEALAASPDIGEVVVAADPARLGRMKCVLAGFRAKKVRIISGGTTRSESVRNAFLALSGSSGVVLAHDMARPFVSSDEIRAAVRAAFKVGAAVLAEPCPATVKEAGPAGLLVRRTLDRSRIFLAQTPQAFRADILGEIYRRLGPKISRYTDEAGMAEACGFKVRIVPGSSANFKITTPSDLRMARAFLSGK